jgi:hypothetical protein
MKGGGSEFVNDLKKDVLQKLDDKAQMFLYSVFGALLSSSGGLPDL